MNLADAVLALIRSWSVDLTQDQIDGLVKPIVDAWRWQRGFRRGWADHLCGAERDPLKHCCVNCSYLEGFEAGWEEARLHDDPEAHIAEWESRRT